MSDKKIKVLHLLASNKFSGAENVVCQIIDFLHEDCEMIYCSPDGDINKQLASRGVNYLPLKKLTVAEVKKAVAQFKPDIVHAHDIKASFFASLAVGKRIPVVAHIHGSDAPTMSKLTPKSVLFKFASRKIKHIFWVSNSCFSVYKFKKTVATKSSVLYNILSLEDLNKKAESDESGSCDIVYLGRLEPVKNPLRMLEIMKLAQQENSEIKCIVMGDGSLMDDCKRFVEENNLSRNIKLLGFVEKPQTILKNAKMLILSSISEGTPMCALEALGLGVPIVSTPTDGMVDLIKNEHNGFLYNTNEEAVVCIDKVLKSYTSMSQKCIDFSKDYNNKDAYKTNILSVYQKVLK